MIRPRSLVLLFQASLLAAAYTIPAAAQDTADKAGCHDHPLFTRMKNMKIIHCPTSDFDSFAFPTGKGNKKTPVEGKRFEIRYFEFPGTTAPSRLATIRNYQQAIKGIGGTVLYEDERYTTLKVSKDGKEIWTQVDTAWGGGFVLTIVEKEAMVQEVAANAEMFRSGLQATGHVEVPGIFFDTGKSELKPESDPAVAEVAKLLKADPALKVYVVGHTDNVASLDLNLKLSQARADSVVQALASKHGIAAARLIGRGVGPLTPVASNDGEDGRARNRRVELVKQ